MRLFEGTVQANGRDLGGRNPGPRRGWPIHLPLAPKTPKSNEPPGGARGREEGEVAARTPAPGGTTTPEFLGRSSVSHWPPEVGGHRGTRGPAPLQASKQARRVPPSRMAFRAPSGSPEVSILEGRPYSSNRGPGIARRFRRDASGWPVGFEDLESAAPPKSQLPRDYAARRRGARGGTPPRSINGLPLIRSKEKGR